MDGVQFGKRVNYYRKQSGMTQSELGKKLGVSQVTVAHYEKGDRFPKQVKLRELALILGVSLDELMGLDDHKGGDEPFGIGEFLEILLEEPLERGWQYIRQWQKSAGMSAKAVFLDVLVPLMEEVGRRWECKEIFISQEHIVTEKVRILLDRLARDEIEKNHILPDRDRRWMGICAPAEKHDLILFMVSQIMRLAGWDVLYLGKDVPLEDLAGMIKIYKPHVVAFAITMEENQNGLGAYLNHLSSLKGRMKLVVGGRGWDALFRSAHSSDIDYFDNLRDYIPFVSELEEDI